MIRIIPARARAIVIAIASTCVCLSAAAQNPTPEAQPAYAGRALPTDNTLNPAISLILDGKYRNLLKDPDTWQLGGFIPVDGEDGHGHGSGVGERGFGIDESELTISGNIDPYFYGYFTAALTPENEVEVEEAHIQNSGLVPGLNIKFGRYFTAIGYQNEQHAHVWDFSDLPLTHKAFLGGQFADDGIQLRFVAPTDLFLEFGVEAGKGSGFPGSEHNKNGGSGLGAFVHVGDDVGVSNSYRVGLSFRRTRATEREYEDHESTDTEIANSFTGRSRIWALDLVWKWAPNGDSTQRNFKFQTEYFKFKENGELNFDTAGVSPAGSSTGSYASSQSGWYAQAIYQFMPRWRVGARYDRLDSGSVSIGQVVDGTLTAADFPVLADHTPKRLSAMVDFSPSEFSRLRLQYNYDEARFSERDSQVVLQYIMSVGAHGAHRF